MDFKLFSLNFIKRCWMVLLTGIIVAGIAGSIYFVQEVKEQQGVMYSSETVFYVDYAMKENGDYYYAYNDAGWSYVVMFDEIIDRVLELIEIPLGRDELREILSTSNISDYKILSVFATADKPELCKPILGAVYIAMKEYADKVIYMDKITLVVEPTTPKIVLVEYYTNRIILCWFVLGVFLSSVILSFVIVLQDKISIPTLIPFKVERIIKKPDMQAFIQEKDDRFINLQTFAKNNYALQELQNGKEVILIIDASKDSWSSLEYFIQQMKQEKKEISKAYLINVDPWIYKWYFGLPFINRKEA